MANNEKREKREKKEKKEKKGIRCITCGISEEEAKENGLSIKKMKACESIKVGETIANIGFVSPANDLYMCSDCWGKLSKSITGDKVNDTKSKMRAFEDFVESSAHLFGLEHAIVSDVCLKMYMRGMFNIAEVNPELAIMMTTPAVDLLNVMINEFKKINASDKNDKNHGGDKNPIVNLEDTSSYIM